jgi:hypothetical protein
LAAISVEIWPVGLRLNRYLSCGESPAQPKFGEALTVGDGTFVGTDVNFFLQINGEILGKLLFHHRLIFGKNLVIEIQGGLPRPRSKAPLRVEIPLLRVITFVTTLFTWFWN